jgi:uncharacterized protein YbjT (DUF2867 family)
MAAAAELHLVTGAFGYSGGYVARRLLAAGHRVRTRTNSPPRGDLVGRIEVQPLAFDRPQQLAESLRGAAALYNTYWVRFNTRRFTMAQAVSNTKALFQAALAVGVPRVVHVSITNPSADSPYEYFRGKAALERELLATGLSYAILRPAVLFGGEDILINNMAWGLRHMPVYPLFGDGRYRLQPIHVEDLAALAVREGASREKVVINAIGPETFTYRGLVEELGRIIGRRRTVMPLPPALAWAAAVALGKSLGDVIVTREEIGGLMDELLYVDAPPAGPTRLTEWARENADNLGRQYQSELARRSRRS